jgi:hypothetical protein
VGRELFRPRDPPARAFFASPTGSTGRARDIDRISGPSRDPRPRPPPPPPPSPPRTTDLHELESTAGLASPTPPTPPRASPRVAPRAAPRASPRSSGHGHDGHDGHIANDSLNLYMDIRVLYHMYSYAIQLIFILATKTSSSSSYLRIIRPHFLHLPSFPPFRGAGCTLLIVFPFTSFFNIGL